MTPAEWESLCHQCGKCCHLMLEDGTRHPTEACSLLDRETNRCSVYEDRYIKKLEAYHYERVCAQLKERELARYYETGFLPEDCGYMQYYKARHEVP